VSQNRRASAALCAAGHPTRKINGSALAAMNGTRLIREAFASPAFISGLKRSASLAADGRRIRIGTRSPDCWISRSTKMKDRIILASWRATFP
jgi:hypothetical protein